MISGEQNSSYRTLLSWILPIIITKLLLKIRFENHNEWSMHGNAILKVLYIQRIKQIIFLQFKLFARQMWMVLTTKCICYILCMDFFWLFLIHIKLLYFRERDNSVVINNLVRQMRLFTYSCIYFFYFTANCIINDC